MSLEKTKEKELNLREVWTALMTDRDGKDSKLMEDVKRTVGLYYQEALQGMVQNEEVLDKKDKALMEAIIACQTYLSKRKDPRTDRGEKRKEEVQNVLTVLRRQHSMLYRLKDGRGEIKAEYKNHLLINNLEKIENEIKNKKQNVASTLQYNDFVEALSGWNDDYVEMHDGKLRAATNVLGHAGRKKTSPENKQIVDRLLEVAVDKIRRASRFRGDGLTPEQEKKQAKRVEQLILRQLGVREGNYPPISMERLRRALDTVNEQASWVNSVLNKKNKKTYEAAMANAIEEMLPGTVLRNQEGSRKFNTYRDNQVKKLKSLIAEGAKYGVKNSNISGGDLDRLAAGHIYAIRDLVYSRLKGMYSWIENFSDGGLDVTTLTENKEVMGKLFAYAIKVEAATTEKARNEALNDMGTYCESYISEAMARDKNVVSLIGGYNIAELSGGSIGLREYMRKNMKTYNDGDMNAFLGLEKLCNLIKRQNELVNKIGLNGYNAKRGEALRTCCKNIDDILQNEELWPEISRVAKSMKGTNLRTGILKLEENMENGAGFSYESFAENIVNWAVKEKPLEEEKVDEVEQKNSSEQENIKPEAKEEEAKPDADEKKSEEEKSQDKKEEKSPLELLQGTDREIAEILLLNRQGSDFIGEQNPERVRSIMEIHALLRAFQDNAFSSGRYNAAGKTGLLSRNAKGHVEIQIGDVSIDTKLEPRAIARHLEADMCQNVSKYGKQTVLEALQESLEQQSAGTESAAAEESLSRDMLYDLLSHTAGIAQLEMSDFRSPDLAKQALNALQNKVNKEDVLTALRDEYKKTFPTGTVNDQATLEAIVDIKKMAENGQLQNKVVFSPDFGKESDVAVKGEIGWTENERKIKEFLADIISPSDQWKNDLTQKNKPEERMRQTIYTHADTVANIIKKPELLQSIIGKLKLDKMKADNGLEIPALEGIGDKIQKMFAEYTGGALGEWIKECEYQDLGNIVRGMVGGQEDVKAAAATIKNAIPGETLVKVYEERFVDSSKRKKAEETGGFLGFLVKGVGSLFDSAVGALGTKVADSITEEEIAEKITELRAEIGVNKKLRELDEQINTNTGEFISKVQDEIEKRVNDAMFSSEQNILMKYGDPTLEDLLENNLRGNSGQGLFTKKILGGYFKSVSPEVKRNMCANIIRDLKPSQIVGNETKEEETRKNEIQMGSILSGLFKGAGPLMHKQLQGIPSASMPLSIQIALGEVKSNLKPISQVVVAARMNRMIENSQGAIEKIEVLKSMGAASIGEAYLCKIYGPAIKAEGREVVIKQLRPDVQKRMEQEEEFFMKCAEETDEGMKKTFAGQLEVYKKELNLRIEAENIKEGDVYNGSRFERVHSEKLVDLVKPSMDTIMLEKAEGTTVGSYYRELDRLRNELKKEYEESTTSAVDFSEIMFKKGEELHKRQAYLIKLAVLWVQEAMYGKGFYQADLHMDNIMVGDNGVTVIDYGNATKLTDDQRREIACMVGAAGGELAEDFCDHYANLLSDESRLVYDQRINPNDVNSLTRKQAFENTVKDVFEKRGAVGTKILLALAEAQKLGLELPNAVYNFSLGQVRLQNTIDSGNKLLKDIKNDVKLFRMKYMNKAKLNVFSKALANKLEEIKKGERATFVNNLFSTAAGVVKTREHLEVWKSIISDISRAEKKDIDLFIERINKESPNYTAMFNEGYRKLKEKQGTEASYEIDLDNFERDADGSVILPFEELVYPLYDVVAYPLVNVMNYMDSTADIGEPDNFVDVMSDVINDNKWNTVKMIKSPAAIHRYTKAFERVSEKMANSKEEKKYQGYMKQMGDEFIGQMLLVSTESFQEYIDKKTVDINKMATFLMDLKGIDIPKEMKATLVQKVGLFKDGAIEYVNNKEDDFDKDIEWTDGTPEFGDDGERYEEKAKGFCSSEAIVDLWKALNVRAEDNAVREQNRKRVDEFLEALDIITQYYVREIVQGNLETNMLDQYWSDYRRLKEYKEKLVEQIDEIYNQEAAVMDDEKNQEKQTLEKDPLEVEKEPDNIEELEAFFDDELDPDRQKEVDDLFDAEEEKARQKYADDLFDEVFDNNKEPDNIEELKAFFDAEEEKARQKNADDLFDEVFDNNKEPDNIEELEAFFDAEEEKTRQKYADDLFDKVFDEKKEPEIQEDPKNPEKQENQDEPINDVKEPEEQKKPEKEPENQDKTENQKDQEEAKNPEDPKKPVDDAKELTEEEKKSEKEPENQDKTENQKDPEDPKEPADDAKELTEEEKKAEKVEEGTFGAYEVERILGTPVSRLGNRVIAKSNTTADEFYVNYNEMSKQELSAMNSNDIKVLENLKKQNKLKVRLGQHLDHRIAELQKINSIAEKSTDKITYAGELKQEGKNKFSLTMVEQPETQNTNNGCWSVSLSTLLRFRGVDLNQRTIRAYRPDEALGDDELEFANADKPNAILNYADLIQKVLPYTIVNQVECREEESYSAGKLLEECIKMALQRDRSPIALLMNGHYRTIYGMDDGNVLLLDPLGKTTGSVKLDQLIEDCTQVKELPNGTKKKSIVFNVQWLQDMKLDKHKEPIFDDTLRGKGVGYVGGELTQMQSEYIDTKSYKGFISGKCRESQIMSILPKTLKTKERFQYGYNQDIFDDIISDAKKANIDNKIVEVLKSYPQNAASQEQMDQQMISYSEKLQKSYAEQGMDENAKKFLQEALEEIRHSFIDREKIEIRNQINTNLRKNDGETLNLGFGEENDKAIISETKKFLQKALDLKSLEEKALTDAEWLEKYQEIKKNWENLTEDKISKEVKEIVDLSARVADKRKTDKTIQAERFTSTAIPCVKLMSDIEAGIYPEKQTWKKLSDRANVYLDRFYKLNVYEKKVEKKAIAKLEKELENAEKKRQIEKLRKELENAEKKRQAHQKLRNETENIEKTLEGEKLKKYKKDMEEPQAETRKRSSSVSKKGLRK